MKTVIIANPHAGNSRVERHWADYQGNLTNIFDSPQILFTTAPGYATQLARQAIHDGAERIVAVGGDGTVNEVVNGFFDNDEPIGAKVSLAIYSLGTGGDFARSIGLSGKPLISAFDSATERRIDVGKASFINHAGQRETRYFLNIASFGSSGLVVKKVNSTSKRFGAHLSFYVGTLRGLLAYQNQRVRLHIDGLADEERLINTVAIANGRYFGGGMMIAPDASLDDAYFDIVIVGDVSALTFLRYAPRLYCGTHLSLPFMHSARGRVVEAKPVGNAPILLELDGEQVGRLPVRYENLPRALRLFTPSIT
jgi:diacylglycerol kinase (ATP)